MVSIKLLYITQENNTFEDFLYMLVEVEMTRRILKMKLK